MKEGERKNGKVCMRKFINYVNSEIDANIVD